MEVVVEDNKGSEEEEEAEETEVEAEDNKGRVEEGGEEHKRRQGSRNTWGSIEKGR